MVRIGLEEFFARSNRKLIAVVEEQGKAALAAKAAEPKLPASAGRFLSEPDT